MELIILKKYVSGEAIFIDTPAPNLQEIAQNEWSEYQPYKLSNGVIFQEVGKEFRTFKCDFSGDDSNWDGYVKGFLYPDNKFTGVFHPVQHSNSNKETMDGHYIHSKSGLTIFGKYYIANKVIQHFIYNFGKLQFVQQRQLEIEPKVKALIKVYSDAVFTKDLYVKLYNQSSKIKEKFQNESYDQYSHVNRLQLKPINSDSIILATALAYSWMPTMLHLYIGRKYSMKEVLESVLLIGKIDSIRTFQKYEQQIIEALIILTECINNSIVGVSKTLHIFYPKTVPMIDSNALKGWNLVFRKYFKKHPELRLNKTIPLKIPNQVVQYMTYWEFLLKWSNAAKVKNLRMLEEPFYWIGKSSKR